VPSELGGASAVDGCTRSLGGIETPEPLVVARIPSVVTSVVLRCVFTSVVKCVLQRTHSGGERLCVRKTACVGEMASVSKKVCVKETPCVSGVVASVPKCMPSSTPCMKETPCEEEAPCVSGTTCARERVCVSEGICVSEARCVRGTACVRSLYVREMTVGMREHAAVSPIESDMVRYVSVVTRRSVCVEWRRRQRQRDKGRVAAVVVLGTAPGLHGSERKVRAVLRTRPPRARLRE